MASKRPCVMTYCTSELRDDWQAVTGAKGVNGSELIRQWMSKYIEKNRSYIRAKKEHDTIKEADSIEI